MSRTGPERRARAEGLVEIPPPVPAPPRRLPHLPLPAYRYLPGLHAHPSREPAWHQFAEFRELAPGARDPTDPRWLRALDLFDHRYYWEAHEALEGLWLELPREAPFAQLCQGLIQCAAATLAHHAGRTPAAERLLGRAARRFGRARAGLGAEPAGIDTTRLLAEVRAFLGGGPWPTVAAPFEGRSGGRSARR